MHACMHAYMTYQMGTGIERRRPKANRRICPCRDLQICRITSRDQAKLQSALLCLYRSNMRACHVCLHVYPRSNLLTFRDSSFSWRDAPPNTAKTGPALLPRFCGYWAARGSDCSAWGSLSAHSLAAWGRRRRERYYSTELVRDR